MKFTSLDYGTDKGGGEVVATKFLKASSKSLWLCFELRSGGGSITTTSLVDPEADSVACYRSDHHAEESLHAQPEIQAQHVEGGDLV